MQGNIMFLQTYSSSSKFNLNLKISNKILQQIFSVTFRLRQQINEKVLERNPIFKVDVEGLHRKRCKDCANCDLKDDEKCMFCGHSKPCKIRCCFKPRIREKELEKINASPTKKKTTMGDVKSAIKDRLRDLDELNERRRNRRESENSDSKYKDDPEDDDRGFGRGRRRHESQESYHGNPNMMPIGGM